MTSTSILFSLLLAAVSAADQPEQQLLSVHDGVWTLTAQHSKPVYETHEAAITVMVNESVVRDVTVDGVTRKEVVTVCRPETRTVTRMVCKWAVETSSQVLDPVTVQARELDGQPLTWDAVARRCSAPTLVLVLKTAGNLSDSYAEVFRPGTIVLTPADPAAVPQVKSAGAELPATLPALPTAPAPELVFLGREDADNLRIRQYGETTRDLDLSVVGAEPARIERVTQTIRRSRTTLVPLTAVQVSTPTQADLTLDRLKEPLGHGEVTAVLSVDGARIDPFWLQNLRHSVLLVRGVQLPPDSGFVPVPAAPGRPLGSGVPAPAAPAAQSPQSPR